MSMTANNLQQMEELLAKCYADTAAFAQIIFPDRFHRPFSDELHRQIFDIIDHSESQLIAIAAPRGIGKTSICTLAVPAKRILFRDNKFIVSVSCSATLAIQQTENLKFELESNPLVRSLFGELKSDSWAKDGWVTNTGVHVLPRGSGQQIRGLLFRNSRPDLILVDDLEDPEAVMSEEQRKKTKEWFYADLMNCIDRGSREWKIVVLGTILHEDSLLNDLLEDPDWHGVRLEICDDSFHSKWPEMMTDEYIRKLYESFKRQGKADTFFREYRNQPISSFDKIFRQEYFKYYEESEEQLTKNEDVESFIVVDPAKTVEMNSCDSAILGVSINLKTNAIYFRDLVLEKLHPDEMYREIFEMALRLRARVVGIEVTSLNEFITQPFRNEIIRRRQPIELVELKPRGGQDKDSRIAMLAPYYRQGLIYHNKTAMAPLEQQLLTFPASKLKDAMDAAAYTIEMLESGERYMYWNSGREAVEDDEFAELLAEDEREEKLPAFGCI